ncbi:MAG: hypothetical protein P1S60_19540, partial [Anaerolineae bacterium]|nr:hypothetical protein [Anaerolineae bacterium]
IELNGQGGLYGLVHAHLECCIDNTDYYEYSGGGTGDRNRLEGQQWGLMNAPLVVDGCLKPEDAPGWGAVWDEDKFQSMVVEKH